MLKSRIVFFLIFIFLFTLALFQDTIGQIILQSVGNNKSNYQISLLIGRLALLPLFLFLLGSYKKIQIHQFVTSIDVKTVWLFIVIPVVFLKIIPLLGLYSISVFIQHNGLNLILPTSWTDFILLCVNAVLLGPIIEEILFRGVLFDNLSRVIPSILALIASSFLFALFHSDDSQLIFIFITGIILALLYKRSNNLVYPIVLHSSLNFFYVLSKLFSF